MGESELGQVVVEVCEEVGLMAADLHRVVMLHRRGELVEHGWVHLLGLVDQRHRAQEGRLQMSQPTLTQGREAAPAVMGLELDSEQIPCLSR